MNDYYNFFFEGCKHLRLIIRALLRKHNTLTEPIFLRSLKYLVKASYLLVTAIDEFGENSGRVRKLYFV